MNPQGADMLAQLRDIHTAPVAPWWPPAPGWWVLAVLLFLLLAYLFRLGYKAWRRRLQRRRMLRWVEAVEADIDPSIAPQAYLAAINRIFKVVAMKAFPDTHCARLQGEEWAGFLQRGLADAPGAEQLAVLAVGPYQQRPHFDPSVLSRLARHWIAAHG